MEVNTKTLLPYLLYFITQQPNLACSIYDFVENLKGAVDDNIVAPYGGLWQAVEFGVKLGENLGLFHLSKPLNSTRLTFKIAKRKRRPRRIPKDVTGLKRKPNVISGLKRKRIAINKKNRRN